MTDDEKKMLMKIFPELKESFEWMLEDIKTRADQFSPGVYSDQLKIAMVVGEMLEKIT